MTKFWMVVAAILFGLTTGCPDGDDDADADCIPACAPGYVCLYGDCVPEGSDTDADADSDTSDDGDTSEVANCPSVAGEWALTYHSTVGEEHYTLTLEQTGCSLTGYEDGGGDITGIVNEDGSLSLQRTYGSISTAIGRLVSPSRLEGTWEDPDVGGSGTWWADRQ